MAIEGKVRTWVQSVAAGFLCVTAAVTFAVAGGQPPEQRREQTRAAASQWVPPGMHEAQAGVDVGPGSDEAQLVTSPQPE